MLWNPQRNFKNQLKLFEKLESKNFAVELLTIIVGGFLLLFRICYNKTSFNFLQTSNTFINTPIHFLQFCKSLFKIP